MIPNWIDPLKDGPAVVYCVASIFWCSMVLFSSWCFRGLPLRRAFCILCTATAALLLTFHSSSPACQHVSGVSAGGRHCLQNQTSSNTLSIVTFNLRSSNIDDELDSWEPYRKYYASAFLWKYDMDLVGTQEGTISQLEFMCNEASVNGRSYAWVGQTSGYDDVVDSAIIYDKSKLQLQKFGVF